MCSPYGELTLGANYLRGNSRLMAVPNSNPYHYIIQLSQIYQHISLSKKTKKKEKGGPGQENYSPAKKKKKLNA